MLDAAVEKTLAQLAQPARPSARTERTVGDPIRTLRAVLAEKECALSPPPGRWAAQAPDTHHATLMYFVGLWALHGARAAAAAGPKKATQRGRGRPTKEQPVAGWLPECGAGAARTATARPAPDDAAVPIAQNPVFVHICATGAWPKASGSTATATASLSSACERGRGVVPVGTMVVMSIRPPCTFRPRLRSSLLCKGD